MIRYRPIRTMLPPLLLLALLVAPAAVANTIVDSQGQEWKTYATADGPIMRVQIDIRFEGSLVDRFWGTNADTNNADPFIYLFNSPVFGEQVWLVWSRERTGAPEQYDIFQRQVGQDGVENLDIYIPVEWVTGTVTYSDRRPCGGLCPLGHHIVFERETPRDGGGIGQRANGK